MASHTKCDLKHPLVPKSKGWREKKLFTVCVFILVVELCERLCYYTVQGSSRNFLEDSNGHLSASSSSSLSACFSMLSYLSCVFGGYIADNRLGRYRTILYFSIVYCVGVFVVAISAEPTVMDSSWCLPLYFIGSFVLVALGTGAIKPNVMNFGAEQYNENDEEDRNEQQTFFSYFYLTINIGCTGAYGYAVNLATSDSSQGHTGSGFFKSYLIAAVAMLVAACAFVVGTPLYQINTATPTPMMSNLLRHLTSGGLMGFFSLLGWFLLFLCTVVVLFGSLLFRFQVVSHVMTWIAFGLAAMGCVILFAVHCDNNFIRPLPPKGETVSTISAQDVRKAFACLPTIICINVGFNVPYNAMNMAYAAQACQMDTRLFGEQLNGAFFSLGDAFAIIIFVPILETVFYPTLLHWRGKHATRTEKYTAGFVFAMAANVSAMAIEHVRRGKSVGLDPQFVRCIPGTENCSSQGNLLSKCSPGASLPMTEMSAFWSLVPMALTGLGEILVNPVIYQYAFEEAPLSLRSVVQALNLVMAGSISNVITASLGPLVPEDLNVGCIFWYLLVNVIVAALALMAYWAISRHEEPVHDALYSA